MATSGSISKKFNFNLSQIKFSWTRASVSVKDNTSTVDWKLEIITGTGGSWLFVGDCGWKVTINTLLFSGSINFNAIGDNETKEIASGTVIIPHNADGTKAFAYDFTVDTEKSLIHTEQKASGTDTLDQIYRSATITSVAKFTDEENPTIVYSNPAGESVTSLQACISLTGADDDVPYRDISKTGSSYTFELTEAERKTLRAGISDTYLTVRFYIKTVIDDITYYDWRTAHLTLVNYTPVLVPTITDINERTIELTGNNANFIKYYSNAYVSTIVQARKEATIVDMYITNGDQTFRLDGPIPEATFEGVTSNTFYFGVTDSRKQTVRAAIVRSIDEGKFIEYIPLTSSLSTKPLDANGNLEFTVKGKYFNGSFGAKDNTMEVEFAVRDEDGNYVFNSDDSGWVILGPITPSVDSDNNYEYTYTIAGLDYEGQYELTVNVIDELSPIQSKTTIVSAVPVFDWSKNDFHHHTDVHLENGKSLRTVNSEDTDVQILGTDKNDILTIGRGNMDAGVGSTEIYGRELKLHSSDSPIEMNNARLDNGGVIYGTTSGGEQITALEPCNSSGNTVLGAGNYAAGSGATNIYGNNVNIQALNTVNINGREYGANKVLWSGTSHMNGSQSVSLSEAISAQPHGIILVFSYYEPSTGYANNVGWSTHFVPKQMVNVNGGGGQCFLMGLNAGFSLLGAKYLYIYNTSISGHAGNTSTGTNSGITFANNEFALRYVIGV